ncbi:ketopantoate reductase family protein [Ornithinibacillus halophilus]|uniref:2-dehydropantoate 2-reductase n=1 Tax=Ornithinibacillus halophilus TaxID=930117 RepID=A0A1M5HS63_9BACI|nr:ketopantoate reductase family protein [Ornithinibacillus halophilus]SHG18698.1 ketopantoate reductase [Ornithinibacillus halophilus]
MNITVLGAGAVGGYFGSRLADAGANVTFLVREKRKEKLESTGLRIKSVKGDTYFRQPNIATDPSEITECDLVLLSVKGYHLENSYPMIEPLVNRGAKILPLLNGVEHYEILEEKFGKEAVIGGLCFIITTLDQDGNIVHTSNQHNITFGMLDDSHRSTCNQLESVLKNANVEYTYSDEIQEAIWNKYAFITAYSGITTASRLEIGPIRTQKETLELYKDAAAEMKQLASAHGVDLGEKFIDIIEERAFQFPENGTSSMHQDFRKGLPLELDSLQGGALRMAKSKGMQLPIIETIYRLLKPYEQGNMGKVL